MDEPSFGTELRRLRADRGLSLRALEKRVPYSRTVLNDWENGKPPGPAADDAVRLDRVLEGGGALVAAAAHIVRANGNAGRLAHVGAKPRTVDAASVDALTRILADMRRLEDTVGAAPLIVATAGPLKLVESLADEARGPIRKSVVDLAGQWGQFAGWLRATSGQSAKAREWYARSLEHATEAGNRDLIATALSMRGNLAWMAHRPGPLVGLSAAAVEAADSPGVRAMAAQQEARGHALLGDVDEVRRLLDRAEVEMADAQAHAIDEPPWIYFYSTGYLEMQRGLAYRLLGDHEDAIAALTAGLAAAGDGLQSAEFVAAYVVHLIEEHLALGNRDVAGQLVEQVRAVAQATGSAQLAADVTRLERRLDP